MTACGCGCGGCVVCKPRDSIQFSHALCTVSILSHIIVPAYHRAHCVRPSFLHSCEAEKRDKKDEAHQHKSPSVWMMIEEWIRYGSRGAMDGKQASKQAAAPVLSNVHVVHVVQDSHAHRAYRRALSYSVSRALDV